MARRVGGLPLKALSSALKSVVGGCRLSQVEMAEAFSEIVDGKGTDALIAAFAVALRMRGEAPEEVAGAAQVMRQRAQTVKVAGSRHVDTCGTGGDGAGTFNVSTTAAFVVAACGLIVAKHGNRGVSSRCGSADVLKELGIDVEAPLPSVEAAISSCGIGFLYAPLYHGALKHAANVRKEIGLRTFFNLLGPLANPARAPYQVTGIYDGSLLETVAEALLSLGTQGALVVHGEDGLDEVTLTAPTRIATVSGGRVEVSRIDPRELGLTLCTPEALKGGEPAENARITLSILEGERSPRRDAVALNAAAALVAAGEGDWQEALARAQKSLEDGSARAKLEALRKATPRLSSPHPGR